MVIVPGYCSSILLQHIAPAYCLFIFRLAIAPYTPLIYTAAVVNAASASNRHFKRENTMPNPLDSLWGTVITGIIVTVIFYYVALWLMGG